MQGKAAPLTPQARKLKRTVARSAATAPVDLSTTENSMARQIPLSGHSAMSGPSRFQDVGAKKCEAGNNEAETMYLYNEYLQTVAMKLLLKKKAEEKEREDIAKLAALVTEENQVKGELSAVDRRIMAVKNLTKLQNAADEEMRRIDNLLAALGKQPRKVLKQLESVLKSLDVLKCKNVDIPQTVDAAIEARVRLENCASLLMSIHALVGNRGDVLDVVNKDLDDMKNTAAALSEISKKVTENLEQLQVDTLEEGEKSLMMSLGADIEKED